MKRFITYIFEYKNGQKCSNTGFIKVDWRKEQCRLEVHIRNLSVKQEQVNCYWVIRREQKVIGILWGEILINQGKGDRQMVFSRDAGNLLNFDMEDVIGIAIKGKQAGYLATSWVDEPGIEFMYGTFPLNEEQGTEKLEVSNLTAAELYSDYRTNQQPVPRPYPGSLSEPHLEPMPIPDRQPGPFPSPMAEPVPRPQREPMAQPDLMREPWSEPQLEPVPRPQREPMVQPGEMSEEKQNMDLEAHHMEENKNSTFRRIDINDIRQLPSANWYLCNNSFLIHGFFNYKYLVIKETEEGGRKKFYLGVPGIFEKPERTMALLFGFSKFESEETAQQGRADIPVVSVGEEIQDVQEGTFGYWFCLLDM